MSVKIRLKRVGAKDSPFYRIVVADCRARRDGRFIEEVGAYRPIEKGDDNFSLDMERVNYWLNVGAQPTDTTRSLIRKARRAAARAEEPEAQPVPAAAPGSESASAEAES